MSEKLFLRGIEFKLEGLDDNYFDQESLSVFGQSIQLNLFDKRRSSGLTRSQQDKLIMRRWKVLETFFFPIMMMARMLTCKWYIHVLSRVMDTIKQSDITTQGYLAPYNLL